MDENDSTSASTERCDGRLGPALVKEADRRIEYEKCPNDRCLDIFAEHQLQGDRDLEQDRNRRQEFAQHQPQRMNGDIGRRIRANLAEKAARLGARKSFDRIFHRIGGRGHRTLIGSQERQRPDRFHKIVSIQGDSFGGLRSAPAFG